MRIYPGRSRKIFGSPPMPGEITEQQFDYFDKNLKKLAHTPWEEIDYSDLWYYIHDLSYMELQKDLFDYLFPVCLDFWYDSLLKDSAAAVGDADFHNALLQGNIFEKMLNEKQREKIRDFFIDGILDRVELEREYIYQSPEVLRPFGWLA